MMREIIDKLHEEYEKDPCKRKSNLKNVRKKYMKRKTEVA